MLLPHLVIAFQSICFGSLYFLPFYPCRPLMHTLFAVINHTCQVFRFV